MRDPFAPVEVVSITDPAVVFESEAKRELYRTTRDPSLWKPRELARPALFTITPCSAETAIKLDAIENNAERALLAFRACVQRVVLPSSETLAAEVQSGYMLAPASWINDAAKRVGPRRVLEIGEAAHRLSMLDDADPLLQPPGQPPQS